VYKSDLTLLSSTHPPPPQCLTGRAVEPVLKFQALAPEQFGPLKTKNHCIYQNNWLAPQIMSLELEPKFQGPASAPPSRSFWLRLQPSEIPWAPAPQPCWPVHINRGLQLSTHQCSNKKCVSALFAQPLFRHAQLHWKSNGMFKVYRKRQTRKSIRWTTDSASAPQHRVVIGGSPPAEPNKKMKLVRGACSFSDVSCEFYCLVNNASTIISILEHEVCKNH